jgi:hypothetical protein
MIEKNINSCSDCPFLHSNYDDYAINYSTTDICKLASYLKLKDEYIDIYNGHESDAKTPEWCPLKKEDYSFKFNRTEKEIIENFQEDFDKIKSEISKLEDAGIKLQNMLKDL